MKKSLKSLVGALCISAGLTFSCGPKTEPVNKINPYPYSEPENKREIQESVKQALSDIWDCQVAYFGENCRFFDADSPEELYKFCRLNYESYGLEPLTTKFDAGEQPFIIYDITTSSNGGGCNTGKDPFFEITATGNLDGDPELDVWESYMRKHSYAKTPEHINAD